MKRTLCIVLLLTIALSAVGATAYTVYGHHEEPSYGYVYCREKSNIRSSHWLNRGDNTIGTLPSGATAEYLGVTWIDVDSDSRPWYKIDYHGIVGWVSGKYTELHEYGSYDDDAGSGYYVYSY